MRPGGGKAKGSQFERDVCKKLSRWLTRDGRDDLFWRSAMSGGRATIARKRRFGRNRKGSSQVGDLCAIHERGQPFLDAFVVECKFYRDLKYKSLLTDSGTLHDFWQKLLGICLRENKHPFLVAKQNGMPPFVSLTQRGYATLFSSASLPHYLAYYPSPDMYLVDFDVLVNTATFHE